MKKHKHFLYFILTVTNIFIFSCSKQNYSYREKVKVNKQNAQQNTPQYIEKIQYKQINIETIQLTKYANLAIGSDSLLESLPISADQKINPLIIDIQKMIPQNSSKASVSHGNSKNKTVKKKINILEIAIPNSQKIISIIAKCTMILGGILGIVGYALAIIFLSGTGLAIAGLGCLIFIIGLLIFFVEKLTS